MMMVRLAINYRIFGFANRFNLHGDGNLVYVHWPNETQSVPINRLEVYLQEEDTWIPFSEFKESDLCETDSGGEVFWEKGTR